MYPLFSRSLLAFVVLFGLASVSVHASEKLERDLLERITKSRAELAAIEARIGQERARYANNLDKKQEETKKMRTEAAALQRVADEQLLGLEQLQTRIDLWSTQSNYQRHLLTSYVEGVDLPTEAFDQVDGAPQIDARALSMALNNVESSLSPDWQDQQIVSASGAMIKLPTLTAGPIEVAFDSTSQTGGLVLRDIATEPRIIEIFDRSSLSELDSLQKTGSGYLSFDPTLGNALQLRGSEETLLTHLGKGGVWAIPIIFFGLLSFVISALKGWQFLRLPKIDTHLVEKLTALIANLRGDPGKTAELKQQVHALASQASAAQQKLIHLGMSWPVSQQRDDLFVAYLMEYKHKLERYMGVVATSAAIAPLLGLLGTVSGMIATFKMMTIFGSGDASTVSGGISEALVTTELGLIVAIPSLLMSALLTRQVKSYTHQLENFAIKLSKIKFAT